MLTALSAHVCNSIIFCLSVCDWLAAGDSLAFEGQLRGAFQSLVNSFVCDFIVEFMKINNVSVC